MTRSPPLLWVMETGDLTSDLVARWLPILDSAERKQAAAFRFERHRRDYVAAHALLRALLTELGANPPRFWRWEPEERLGKPRLTAPPDSSLCFNLTHTEDLVAAVVASGREVGIDAEKRDRLSGIDDIIDRVLTPGEQAALPPPGSRDAERREAFLRLWVLKEAAAKAVGLGLSLPLTAISVVRETPPRIEIHDPRTALDSVWDFLEFQASPNHSAAVVAERTGKSTDGLDDLDWQKISAEELDAKLFE